MDTRSLELFADLARTLKFRATARRQHLTPSALSRAIARIEADVGQRLVDRDRRAGVRLTPAGERFREYAGRALAEWDHFQATASADAGDLRGHLSIFCSVTASHAILPHILTRLRDRHPHISVRLTLGDVEAGVERVSSGESDLAIVVMPDRPPKSLAFARVLESPLTFIAPVMDCPVRAMVMRPRIDWERVPLVLPEAGRSRREVEQWFRARGRRPMVYAHVPGHEAIMALVALGFGVGVVPRFVAEHRPAELKLDYIEHGAPRLNPYVAAACVRRRAMEDSPVIRAAYACAAGG